MTLKTPPRTQGRRRGFLMPCLVEGFKGVQEGDIIECIKHENVTRRIKM